MSEPEFKFVEGRDELIRDTANKAVINIDHGAYTERKRQKEIAKERREKELGASDKISQMEGEMAEMKRMLEILLARQTE